MEKYAHGENMSHALAYVHATEVGGTHPALVEAMGYGNCVVVNDTPENREVAGDTGLYFRARDPVGLAARLDELRLDPALAAARGSAAAARAARLYSWERVADQYAELFRHLADRKIPVGSRRASCFTLTDPSARVGSP